MNSLPKTVTRQRCGCDLNPGPSATESSMLTTRLSSHRPSSKIFDKGSDGQLEVDVKPVEECLHPVKHTCEWMHRQTIQKHKAPDPTD